MLKKLLATLLIVTSGLLIPVPGTHADEYCGDDPILSIGGIETAVLVQIPVSAVPSVPKGEDVTITVEVPRDVAASILWEDKGLKYPNGRPTGIGVKTTIVASNAVNGSPQVIPIKVTVYVPTVGPQFSILLTVSTSSIKETKTGEAGKAFTLQINLP